MKWVDRSFSTSPVAIIARTLSSSLFYCTRFDLFLIKSILKTQMKIRCDVCNKDEASVFCTADDAALCDACDHQVHHANKLAGKHQRFSLLHPSPKQFPLCDICQEKRAFLFCQQDRAILCRDCDLPIHRANEHTQKHNRFLLTGVKLSPTSSLYLSSSSSANDGGGDVVPNLVSQNSINNPISAQPAIPNATALAITSTDKGLEGNQVTSSISEYLLEMLPGWRVEDFLDSFPASFGFSKSVDDILPNWDADLETNLGSFSSPQKMGIWVPQAPPPPPCPSQHPSSNVTTFGYGSQISLKESKETPTNKSGMTYRGDGCFTVPQISPPSTTVSKKRSRTFGSRIR